MATEIPITEQAYYLQGVLAAEIMERTLYSLIGKDRTEENLGVLKEEILREDNLRFSPEMEVRGEARGNLHLAADLGERIRQLIGSQFFTRDQVARQLFTSGVEVYRDRDSKALSRRLGVCEEERVRVSTLALKFSGAQMQEGGN